MRRLSKPETAQGPVYDACIVGIRNRLDQARFSAIAQLVNEQEQAYEQLATATGLHLWASHDRGGDEQLAIGSVTRGDFKRMYNGQLARRGSSARKFYDQLKLSAPNNICPYCGFGVVETLDHFLPKSQYSSLSVLPLNLLPACSDCNRKKHDAAVTSESISSHPYYEEARVFEDEWLFARIIQSTRPSAEFYLGIPVTWSDTTTRRVVNHFRTFDLASRYATQAAERLIVHAAGIDELVRSGASADVDSFLQLIFRNERRLGINSWQAALVKAAVSDPWFRTEGYLKLI